MNTSDQEQNIVIRDSARQQIDTSSVRTGETRLSDSDVVLKVATIPRAKTILITDTSSVCSRNPISDLTFFDSTNFVLNPSAGQITRFPFVFYKEREHMESVSRVRYFQSLLEGEKLPVRTLHNDWFVFIILLSVFLYTIIRSGLTKNIPALSKYFLFRGIGDSSSRDSGTIFHLNSTILNLISFINIALFAYCFAYAYELIPVGFSGFRFWLLALGSVIALVTMRHIICFLTGRASNQQEIFREYILTIYQSYQYSAFILLFLVILISYSSITSVTMLLYAGILIFMTLYVIRLIRLFLIFMNRNVSILYFLLYLCALEFLPVVVLVKFLTGLF